MSRGWVRKVLRSDWFNPGSWCRAATVVATIGALALGAHPGSVSAAPDPQLERDLVAITNLDRTSNGLSSLIEDNRLIELARDRSDDMLAQDYFSHEVPPDGEKVFAEMQRRGIEYRAAGENLSWNNAARDATVQTAQKSFMNSPTHRANVLREDFVSIGTGAVPATGVFRFSGASAPISVIMFTALFLRPFDAE